jgi:hypothetical protein
MANERIRIPRADLQLGYYLDTDKNWFLAGLKVSYEVHELKLKLFICPS